MTDSVVKEILRENPNQKIKAGVMEDAYTYAEQLYKGEEKKTRLDYLRTKVCETLNIAVTSSPEEAQAALNLAKEKKKQEEQQGRLRGTGSGPAWEAFKEAEAFLKGAEELKEAAIKASEAEAKFLQELDRAPKEKKTEAKKQAKPAKKICSCGNKDCMPRPAKTAWVNGVKRDQTVLQNNWDRKHSAVV